MLALRRRLTLRIKDEFNPYPDPPAGAAPSPNQAHFKDCEKAPMQLTWSNAEIQDPVQWQRAVRANFAVVILHRWRAANSFAWS